MKIKSIEHIRNYGIFMDYRKGSAKDFCNLNVIFGWNYSGKTTLSRIFRSLEKQKPHPDYREGKFKILTEDGNIITESNLENNELRIRVFNSDYVTENLKWDNTKEGFMPILLLGEKGELSERLESLNREQDILINNRREVINTQNSREGNYNESLSREARRIRSDLNLSSQFNRNNLRSFFENKNIKKWLLEENEFKHLQTIAFRTDKMELIDEVFLELQEDLITKTKNMLQKVVTPTKTIQRLKENSEIENWVGQGRKIHQDKTKCEFCQSALPEDLFEQLDLHFSKDYSDFREEIKKFSQWLLANKIGANARYINRNEFYPEFREEFDQINERYKLEISKYNNVIDELIKIISQKTEKLGEQLILDDSIVSNIDEIQGVVSSLNELILKHKYKTQKFNEEKQNSMELLKQHYVSRSYKDLKVEQINEKNESLRIQKTKFDKEIKNLSEEISELEPKISESAAGAVRLNHFIKLYFGNRSPIEIREENERFVLYRGENYSENLSEGEKTAISFAYFLTCLEDKDMDGFLDKTIVFIDDPISSLDENHIYNSYALIETFLKGKCAQLFVSTHNHLFFSLLKDLFPRTWITRCNKFNERKNFECKTRLYQLDRKHNNTNLDNLDCLLCKFSTEYQYIFYKIYQIITSVGGQGDDYDMYLMPNLLRRFLESYLKFYYPNTSFGDSLDILIVNPSQKTTVYKIVDEFSHNEDLNRSFRLFTVEEIKEAAAIIFSSFRENESSKDYVNRMLGSIGADHSLDDLVNKLEYYITKPVYKQRKVKNEKIASIVQNKLPFAKEE